MGHSKDRGRRRLTLPPALPLYLICPPTLALCKLPLPACLSPLPV